MPRDNLPRKDGELLPFATNISTRVTATPAAFGCTSTMATALAGYLTAYSAALEAAQNPQTRGHSTIFARDTARTNLVAYLRTVIRQIQGTSTVTNQQRTDLGINVRKQPQPIPTPGFPPEIDINAVNGRTVSLRIHKGNSTKRGKPDGVASALVMSFVGTTPSPNLTEWTVEGITTRTKFDVIFPTSLPAGQTVFVTAMWTNPRGQTGPAADPRQVVLGGGTVGIYSMQNVGNAPAKLAA